MLNKVTLIGRLGADPEAKTTQSGVSISNFTLATSRKWKDKKTGENAEETEWHRVVFFNRLAEVASEYLKKGSLIYMEGRIKTTKFTDSEGKDKYSTNIVGEKLTMLSGDSRKDYGNNQNDSKTDTSGSNDNLSKQLKNQPQSNYVQTSINDFDDDIPF